MCGWGGGGSVRAQGPIVGLFTIRTASNRPQKLNQPGGLGEGALGGWRNVTFSSFPLDAFIFCSHIADLVCL